MSLQSTGPYLLLTAAVALLLGAGAVFNVQEGQQALVQQFGDVRQRITEPGLHFKLPLIQQVRTYEKRILNVDPPAEEVLLSGQKRIVVDAFARYRITDMLKFYQALNTEAAASQRLNSIISAALRSVLGRVAMTDVLSEKRNALMASIRDVVNTEAKRFGIEIVDVRIVRADLPEQTSQSVYARMRSEREREAREARAQGQELAQEIRAKADRDRTVLLAQAEKDAQVMRGEGDRDAIGIYAQSYGVDPDFYAFYRSLEAYRTSLADPETTLVLSPDSPFFRYLQAPARPGKAAAE